MNSAKNLAQKGFVCLLLSLAVTGISTAPALASQYAYVTNTGSNNVLVIDTATKLIMAAIQVGEFPAGMAITPDGSFVYVANFHSNTVSVINTASNMVATNVTVGANPQHVAITPDGAFAYVTNDGSNTVSVINTSSNTVVTNIVVGQAPALIAITPDGAYAYVANQNSNNVSVIATATNAVVSTVPAGTSPQCLAITPDGAFVYVDNRLSNDMSVIATASNTVVATIRLGSGPNQVAITPNGAYVYVTNWGDSTLSIVDTLSNTVVDTVAVGPYPAGVAIAPDGSFAYVANSGADNLSIIDTTSHHVTGSITVGGTPVSVVFEPVPIPPQPLQFVPVTPCRVADTRNNQNPIQGGEHRDFAVPQLGGCGIPTTATAYSLNVTIVPRGYLGFLTIWPTGKQQPLVSTMNSPDGRVKANAAIVGAGRNHAVSVYVTQTTDVILDIDGYFAPAGSQGYQFYKLTPCRVIDTRTGFGDLKGPYLAGGAERDFPVRESDCIPRNVDIAGYSMNFTVVPHRVGEALNYLTVWPQGDAQPLVSTLNNPTATVVANAAVVPAGQNGGISTFAYDDTDLIVDIDGYFASPGQGGYSLYSVSPCRVYDSRNNQGQPFQGERTIDVAGSACAPPASAQSYVLNGTVVPSGSMGYLSLWPDGEQMPVVSTLNAYDGLVTSNMAIVPTSNGSIDAYAAGLTQLILDISGYFAP